jgi:excisionase family DNA binding protein
LTHICLEVSDILRDYHRYVRISRSIDALCKKKYTRVIIVLMEVNILSLSVDGENYYTAKEAAEYLGISRDTFYRNVKDRLPTYNYGALRRQYFRQSDLDRFKGIRPADGDKQYGN